MSAIDNLLILNEAYVFNSASATSIKTTIIDLQGDNSTTTTATGAAGYGAGPRGVYFTITAPVLFTTITSIRAELQTSDTFTGTLASGALSGTITDLYDSAVLTVSSNTVIGQGSGAKAGNLFPNCTGYVPYFGCKRYVQMVYTIVGPSASEVGSVTAKLDTKIDALQSVAYTVTQVL